MVYCTSLQAYQTRERLVIPCQWPSKVFIDIISLTILSISYTNRNWQKRMVALIFKMTPWSQRPEMTVRKLTLCWALELENCGMGNFSMLLLSNVALMFMGLIALFSSMANVFVKVQWPIKIVTLLFNWFAVSGSDPAGQQTFGYMLYTASIIPLGLHCCCCYIFCVFVLPDWFDGYFQLTLSESVHLKLIC